MDYLARISKKGKAMFLAYDQGFEHGPTEFDQHSVDPNYILHIADKGKFTAVITHRGIAEHYYPAFRFSVPLIVKLNGKTALTNGEPFSALLCSVDEAHSFGAAAIGYTIYLGSQYESEMLQTFANLVPQAHAKHMAAIAWVYPRGGKVADDADPKIVAYAGRIGMELGADMVKIKYPGSVEALRWAIQCAERTKVVVAGGAKVSPEEAIHEVRDVMQAGAYGVAIGRNIWQHENPLAIASEMRSIVIDEN